MKQKLKRQAKPWELAVGITVIIVLLAFSAYNIYKIVNRDTIKAKTAVSQYEEEPNAEHFIRMYEALRAAEHPDAQNCLEDVFRFPTAELEQAYFKIYPNGPNELTGEDIRVECVSFVLSEYANQNDKENYKQTLLKYLPQLPCEKRMEALGANADLYKTDFAYQNRDMLLNTLIALCDQETEPPAKAAYYSMLSGFYNSVYIRDAKTGKTYDDQYRALLQKANLTEEEKTTLSEQMQLNVQYWDALLGAPKK